MSGEKSVRPGAPAVAYIGLGSNLGERAENIAAALRLLAETPGVKVTQTAAVIETVPVSPVPQGKYLNTVCEAETSLPPEELLRVCLDIENRLGRVRAERWGARTIDLDLLLYGREVRDTPTLALPHPHLHARRFVLGPLCEIAPHAFHPVLGRTAAEILAELQEKC